MIKLQDFAKECGVTDRAIQKHLKTYEEELAGLYQRKGPNGTWLTDEACKILRSKMRQQPIVVGDASQQQEIEQLKQQLFELQKMLQQSQAMLSSAQLQISEGQKAQLALVASEQEKKHLSSSLDEANNKIKELEEKRAAEALERAQERAEAQKQIEDARNAENAAKAAQERSEKEFMELPLLKRLFYKKGK